MQLLVITSAYVHMLRIQQERALQQGTTDHRQQLKQKDEDHKRMQSFLQEASQHALNDRDSKHQAAMQQLMVELQTRNSSGQQDSLSLAKQTEELKAANKRLTSELTQALSKLKRIAAITTEEV